MNDVSDKKGFTLVELLVALAIIVAIVSMVYGSYAATSKSTHVHKAKIAASAHISRILEQMAEQIRCAYANMDRLTAAVPAGPPGKEKLSEDIISYFDGNPNDPGGQILHLVTTHAVSTGQRQKDGLFDVTYTFDEHTGMLSLNQTQFVGIAKASVEKSNWKPLADNIRSVELSFFDGRQWLPSWDFKGKRVLPCAVKIGIAFEDENCRKYCRSTVAHIFCRGSRPDALVVADKR